MWWLVWTLALADTGADCLEPLTLRGMRPDFGAVDVPTNARVTVSLIGGGAPEHFDLRLQGPTGLVETVQESWCYVHESDYERHCTVVLTPLAALEGDAAHTVYLDPSDRHPEPLPAGLRSSFSTGSSTLVQTLDAPVLQYLGVRPRPEEDIEPCEWTDAEQADFTVSIAATEGSGMATVEIIETLDEGGAASVHTLFPSADGGTLDFRQVLEPGDTRPRCYEAVAVDATGAVSPPSEPACIYGGIPVEEAEETHTGDTAISDSAETVPTATDSGTVPSGTSELPPVLAATGDGCGKGASVLLVWTWLVGVSGRRRQRRLAP